MYRKERAVGFVLTTSPARAEHHMKAEIFVQAVVVMNGQTASIWRYTITTGGQRRVKSCIHMFWGNTVYNSTAEVYSTPHATTFLASNLLPTAETKPPQSQSRIGLQ